jgi:hypothetical protein
MIKAIEGDQFQREAMNQFSFWFPAILAAGVPYPKTMTVSTEVKLLDLLDGKEPEGWATFLDRLGLICKTIGYPCFLKTGVFSGKHKWRDTCYITGPDVLPRHICELVEYSQLVDFLGLPVNEWVVRELLPTFAPFTSFLGMPVTRERRYFIRDGEVLCHHPYWPIESIETTAPEELWKPELAKLNEETPPEVALLTAMSKLVSREIEGEWSLDWLHAEGNWWAIDMALAERSFHWEGCPRMEQSSG